MKPLHLPLSAFLVAILPVAAFAQSMTSAQQVRFDDIDVGQYSDGPWDREINVAVSALTKMDVLEGNDDGTFAAERRLNRAEFVQIIMRLIDSHSPQLNCFPDVSPAAWYADAVCSAKAAGLVRGNAQVGVSEDLWRFEPARDIQYEEAVKVLATLYAMPLAGDTEGADWYVPYLKAAADAQVDIDGLIAGDRITREEMARLTVAFVAESQGRLDELRDAERGSSSSSSSSRSSSSRSSNGSSVSSGSSSSSTSSSSSHSSMSGTTVRSHILVLGEVSPPLASIDLFSNLEPVDIDSVTVTFASPVPSVGSLIIYDDTGLQIGTATSVGGSSTQFHGSIGFGKLLLPYREERGLYVEARLKSKNSGGISGERIEIDSITVEGTGRWTTEDYSESSNETFPEFETAFAAITGITNAGSTEGLLVSGVGKILADFNVHASTPESQHEVRLTDLTFDIERAGNVTLSNVFLRNEDNSAMTACTVGSSTVTCDDIDAGIGIVDDVRRIRLIGDVSVSGSANTSLSLVLNQPGSPSADGDITWTDGSTTFTWVDIEQPVFRGTVWR